MTEEKKHKIIDTIQWVLIVLLSLYCVYLGRENKKMSTFHEIKRENTYLKIYDSQSIEALKKENKALYDTIKQLKNVESAIQIEYVYKYKSDTVFVYDDKMSLRPDSVYHYENNSDSINYVLDIKANNLKWHKLNLSVNDRFTLITKENNDKIETSIDTDYGKIENTTMWHKKKSWKDRIVVGPSIGAGYGMINKNFDFFVGGSVTVDLW